MPSTIHKWRQPFQDSRGRVRSQLNRFRLWFWTVLVLLVLAFIVFILLPPEITGFEGRTWWDWLELLLAPLALIAGAAWINRTLRKALAQIAGEQHETYREIEQQNREMLLFQAKRDQILREIQAHRFQLERESRLVRSQALKEVHVQRIHARQEIEARRQQTERELAAERLRESTLQAYLDTMTGLLIAEDLFQRKANLRDPIRRAAQARTVTALRLLDRDRRDSVTQFLRDSGLADGLLVGASLAAANLSLTNLSALNLSQANLSGADLSGAFLSEANLSGALLILANLSEADLYRASLADADLSGADLHGAQVSEEQLSKTRHEAIEDHLE